jgi:phosphate transport system permease protein
MSLARSQDKVATAVMWLAGMLILLILVTFLGYMLIKGLPVLSWDFITGKSSDINAGGGVGPQLFNSFYILGLSMLFSIPAAVGAGIYLAEYAGNDRLTDMIRLSTESLATVPSIVLGLFGMIIFVNIFGMGFSIIGGSLTLMLLNLPVLVRVTEESIRTVPAYYREASLALGATKWQTIWRVVLPNAMPGIITGITLTAGRALGETAILIFTAGTTVSRTIPDFNVMAAGETLAVHMWYVMAVGLVPDRVAVADGTGALLIITILIFNLMFALPSKYIQRKMASGGH